VNTLFARLSLAFAGILLLLGLSVMWLSHRTSQDYFLEFTQQLNAPIAMYMADNGDFITGDEVNPLWLSELAPHVMMINPSIEVYMLDNTGAIIGSPPNNEAGIARTHVDLQPIREFLQPDRELPIQGDDPKSASKQSIFSAFPITVDNEQTGKASIAGYVYAVVASDHHQSVLGSISESYSFKNLIATLTGALLLALLSGLMVFLTLTRRLKNLTNQVSQSASIRRVGKQR